MRELQRHFDIETHSGPFPIPKKKLVAKIKDKDGLISFPYDTIDNEVIESGKKLKTIGDNDGPCHMHIDSSLITEARFVQEKRTDRTSYSIRFFDKEGEKRFSTVFAKMYDEKLNLNPQRKKLYDDLFEKYGSQQTIKFVQELSN